MRDRALFDLAIDRSIVTGREIRTRAMVIQQSGAAFLRTRYVCVEFDRAASRLHAGRSYRQFRFLEALSLLFELWRPWHALRANFS